MTKSRIKSNDPEMLKQMIIHYKSELSRYQAKVADYQENYHYQLLEQLKKENLAFRMQKEENEKEINQLTERLTKMQEEYQALAAMAETKQSELNVLKDEVKIGNEMMEKKLEELSNAYQQQLDEREKSIESLESELKSAQQLSDERQQALRELQQTKTEMALLKEEIKEKDYLIEQLNERDQSIEEKDQAWFVNSLKYEQESEEEDLKPKKQVLKRIRTDNQPPMKSPFTFGKGENGQ